jgi:hypothetical protein
MGSADFHQIACCTTNSIDDGIVTQQMLTERTSEADFVVMECTQTTDARDEQVEVAVVLCAKINNGYILTW